MSPRKAKLQRQVLALRSIPGISALYRLWYAFGQNIFVRFARGEIVVKAVYLRRGGGRAELVAGASDLDFFLVLETLPAEKEMEFLKRFWSGYHRLRLLFPFFGEVLMGDENELGNWLSTPATRAYESRFSWKLLWGKDCLSQSIPVRPDLRDLFSEGLKHYSDLLQVVLKLQPEQFHAALRAHQPGAVHLRHAAKSALDLFRLHASSITHQESLWRASRFELTQLLPRAYGENLEVLQPLLRLEGDLFQGQDPFLLFSDLAHTALGCLHEMAAALRVREEAQGSYSLDCSARGTVEPYSLSVRELFAERILLRHQHSVSRAILAETTAGMYFSLRVVPSLDTLRELLVDLRDVSFSFDRLSVAIPLTELTFAELERTSLLDTPFHSFAGHREIKFNGNNQLETRPYEIPAVRIPIGMLRKTFAELSFSLRLQPKELPHFLDKIVSVVLALRLAADHREVCASFNRTLALFGKRYPLRAEHLNAKIYPYLPLDGEAEEKIWSDLYARLADHQEAAPEPTANLRARLESIRGLNAKLPEAPTSDLWINLTPFLRMEMNTMKEKYFEKRPVLKI